MVTCNNNLTWKANSAKKSPKFIFFSHKNIV